MCWSRFPQCRRTCSVKWNHTTSSKFCWEPKHRNLTRTKAGWFCAGRKHRLQIGFSSLFTSLHFYFTRFCLTVQTRAAAPRYVAGLLLITQRVPTAFWSGVDTERDAWSLWSVSQQQTVHTSRQRLGIVAHFRTSVHDTVSVVTLSSLVPC